MNELRKNDLATVVSHDRLYLVRVTSHGQSNAHGLRGALLNINGIYYTADVVEEIRDFKGADDLRHNQIAREWGYNLISAVNDHVYRLINHDFGG